MPYERVARVKQVGTAVALVVAPLVYMIGQALQPDFDTSEAAEQLPVLVEHGARGTAALTISILGLILFVPAILGLMRMMPGRGAWLSLIGGSFAIAGAVLVATTLSAIGLVPFELAELWETEGVAVEPALQKLIDNAQGQGAIGAYLGIGFILLPLGLLLTAIGLWRSRAVPRWVAVVIAIGAVGYLAGVDHWIRAADAAILLVGMGAVGFRMLGGVDATTPRPVTADLPAASPAHP
ncbi:MAG: hypothetical protein ACRD1H_06505 [Vicinamibacterales bacterium]